MTLVGNKTMNKKLIASLLTLGLVLSPVAGAVADEPEKVELSAEESKEVNNEDLLALINAYVEDFENTKKSEVFRLASTEKQEEIKKVMKEAADYVNKAEPSQSELETIIGKIEAANKGLAANAKANLDGFKAGIIKLEALLKNHEDKKDSEEYKKVQTTITDATLKLRDDQFSKITGDGLVSSTKGLEEIFKTYKDSLEDTNEYNPNEEDIKNFEISLGVLLDKREKLLLSHEDFIKSDKYKAAGEDKKEAYIKAYETLAGLEGKVNLEDLVKALDDTYKAKQNIDATSSGPKTASNSKEIEKKTIEVLNKLRKFVIESADLTKDLKDLNLLKEYQAEIAKAKAYTRNHVNGIERDLKTYEDLASKLSDLKARIEKAKGKQVDTPTEKSKLDILKEDLKKAEEFRSNPAFIDEPMDKQGKLNDAILSANELLKKEKITDEEAEKASKALNEALKTFTNFKDVSEAKAAIKGLLDKTVGINIERFYGEDQKEAKETYTEAKETASKLVDKKDAKLEELDKAYKDFKNSIDKLATFLTSRIQKILDEDKNFRDSEKYKALDEAAKKNNKQDPAIINYIDQIGKAQALLKESELDANKLDDIYNKLLNAKSEIKGDISAGERKLTDAIIDGYAFMETEKYKNAAVSQNKNLKDAAENYKLLLETAETYKKSGNFESQEAKDLMDALAHARGLLEGKISEKEYLSNKYYHILKTLSKHKGYKEINQASRKKLEGALKLYEESSDKEAIFKALDEAMNDDAIKGFIKKIEEEKNPSLTRDKLLEDLTTLINEDKKLKEGGFKYQKAQKALRDAYDLALKEANELIGENKNPTEEEVRATYKKLLNARNSLDGDKFDKLRNSLAARFKKDQLKIANPDDRKAIAAKINSLSGEEMTMDDAIKVEKELNELINKKVVTTTTRPISTITNPGSSVRTGIEGVAKVAVVLVAALGIYKLISKKGDKNETN